MKTLISAVLFAAILFSANPNKAQAQVQASVEVLSADTATGINSNANSFTAENTTRKVSASTLSLKMTKDFSKSFRNVNNHTWYKLADGGYIANFLSEGIDYRITYDQKGSWNYNLLTYTEDHLPFSIRDLVKSKFYDFNIMICYEYQTSEGKAYVIKMEDNKSYKTLKIFDGEIVSEDDLQKSN